MNKDKKESDDSEKRVKIKTIIKTIFIFLIVYFVLVGFALYFLGEVNNRFVKKTIEYIPYPAVFVGSDSISFKDLSKRTESARNFYESQDFSEAGFRVDFSTEDGKKRLLIKEKGVLNKFIDDLIIEKEAQKRGIKLTNEIIDQEIDRKLKEYGTENYLRENLKRLYDWELEDFKKNIVRPDLYKEKLIENIEKNDFSYEEARKKINDAYEHLKENKNFSETAKKYSDGESAENGGAMGWFSYEQMLPEISRVAFSINMNQESEIITSPIGYHIIKVEDKKEEDGVEMVEVSQIFIRTKNFYDWLSETKKDYTVFVLLKNFKWDEKEGAVEFKDREIINYEREIMENPIDDPSIIF
jgi:parvulin-like peptidyl-prolyl isomerase